jgi:hypothetical protein
VVLEFDSVMICVEVCEKVMIDWWRFEVVRDKRGGGYGGLWWLWLLKMVVEIGYGG